jgi:hypothetical protein
MSGLVKPLLERTEIELEYILRWEDDGGFIINDAVESIIMLNFNLLPFANELHA